MTKVKERQATNEELKELNDNELAYMLKMVEDEIVRRKFDRLEKERFG